MARFREAHVRLLEDCAGVQRDHHVHAPIQQRQTPIGIGDDPGPIGESPRRAFDGGCREVDAYADAGAARRQRGERVS
jgi:hypothetical protein